MTEVEKRAFDALRAVVIIITDLQGRIALWSTAAEELYGWWADEVIGRTLIDIVPSELSRGQAAQIMASLSRGERWEGEMVLRRRDGTPFVAWVSDAPYLNAAGERVGVIGLSRDLGVTRSAARNLDLLVHLGPILDASLDYQEAANQACRALIPAFADIAAIVVLDEADVPKHLGVAAGDPAIEQLLRETPMAGQDIDLVRRAMSTGRAELSGGPPSAAAGARPPADEYRTIEDIDVTARIVAPLVARDRPFGIVGFAMIARSGRSFAAADLSFAEELGRRVGLAIENAHLHTRLRASEAAAVDAYQRARVAEERKDTFLAMLGHELRNPLAPIVTALELMKKRSPLGREEAVISRQIAHLGKLVDDLLDVAHVSQRKLVIDPEPIEVARIVASAIELTGPIIEQRSHHLTVDVPSQGLIVDADFTRLAQVVSNLLTNAAKYTDPGGHIRVRAWRDAADVVVSVADDGTGIAPEALPHIFDAFAQGPRGHDRAQGGLGIGLTLARDIVELHGGTLVATSRGLGYGTELVVRLVPAKGSRPPEELEKIEPARHSARLRVLLVDDNVDALEVLADLLSALGHEVFTAADGPTALRLAAAHPLDVAVLDIGLPIMDGYELAGHLREQAPTLPLIALTGYGQPEDHERTRQAGFAVHLVKPIDLGTLLRALTHKA